MSRIVSNVVKKRVFFFDLLSSFYAKDLRCPKDWEVAFDAILPAALECRGSLDLFRHLPKEVQPEVLMAYTGTKGSL
jgi:hypothetical protein